MESEIGLEAQFYLKKGGWFLGRKINVAEYENLWKEKGLAWFDSASHLFEEFGDVNVYDYSLGSLLFFEPKDILDYFDEIISAFLQYNGDLISKLCPIGSIDGSVLILISDQEYVFFGGFNLGRYSLTLFDIGINNFLDKYFNPSR